MKKLLLTFIILLTAVSCYAGEGSNISGQLYGVTSNTVISVARTECGVSTLVATASPDRTGAFYVEGLARGTYLLSAYNQKYEFKPSFIEVKIPGINKDIIFYMVR